MGWRQVLFNIVSLLSPWKRKHHVEGLSEAQAKQENSSILDSGEVTVLRTDLISTQCRFFLLHHWQSCTGLSPNKAVFLDPHQHMLTRSLPEAYTLQPYAFCLGL